MTAKHTYGNGKERFEAAKYPQTYFAADLAASSHGVKIRPQPRIKHEKREPRQIQRGISATPWPLHNHSDFRVRGTLKDPFAGGVAVTGGSTQTHIDRRWRP